MSLRATPSNSTLRTVPQVRTIQGSDFRELPAIEHWSGHLKVSGITKDEFTNILQEVAKEVGIRISGWAIGNKDGFTYYMCRHQRKKYGPVPTIEKYKEALEKLAEKTNALEYSKDSSENKNGFRVLFGLRKGYTPGSGEYTIDEVKRGLQGEKSFVNSKATILAAKPNGEVYTEPAVLITGDLSKLDMIHHLADTLKQERFTVEDFGNPKEPITYTIETRHCTEPET